MNTLKNRIIWLSGASCGIGLALAEELIRRGAKLIISGRNVDAMSKIDGVDMVLKCDATQLSDWQICATKVAQEYSKIDSFVYNSGTCEYPPISDFKYRPYEDIFAVNYFGLIKGLEVTLPLLRLSDNGQIVGMSSSVSLFPLPRAQAYGSSKAAVTYFLRSLRTDLYKDNIDVSIILPGFVRTPLTDRNDFDMPFIIEADEAAQRIADGMQKRDFEIDFPKRFTWILRILAHLPQRLQYIISRKFSQS